MTEAELAEIEARAGAASPSTWAAGKIPVSPDDLQNLIAEIRRLREALFNLADSVFAHATIETKEELLAEAKKAREALGETK